MIRHTIPSLGTTCGVALALVAGFGGSAEANRSGIAGRAQIGCGGGGCHNGGDMPTVELVGPTSLEPGGVADFVLRIGGGQSAAGANIESSGGLLVPGEGLVARTGQLVHAGDARTYTDDFAEFEFEFEAPDTPGTVELFAAGNSVDNNFQSSGDAWALTSVTITVGNGIAPDGGPGPAPDAGDDGDTGGDSGCQQRPGAPAHSPLAVLVVLGGAALLNRRRTTRCSAG